MRGRTSYGNGLRLAWHSGNSKTLSSTENGKRYAKRLDMTRAGFRSPTTLIDEQFAGCDAVRKAIPSRFAFIARALTAILGFVLAGDVRRGCE